MLMMAASPRLFISSFIVYYFSSNFFLQSATGQDEATAAALKIKYESPPHAQCVSVMLCFASATILPSKIPQKTEREAEKKLT
jgi:hypothetical protein